MFGNLISLDIFRSITEGKIKKREVDLDEDIHRYIQIKKMEKVNVVAYQEL